MFRERKRRRGDCVKQKQQLTAHCCPVQFRNSNDTQTHHLRQRSPDVRKSRPQNGRKRPGLYHGHHHRNCAQIEGDKSRSRNINRSMMTDCRPPTERKNLFGVESGFSNSTHRNCFSIDESSQFDREQRHNQSSRDFGTWQRVIGKSHLPKLR